SEFAAAPTTRKVIFAISRRFVLFSNSMVSNRRDSSFNAMRFTVMSHQVRRRRVRVVTDPAKYRRHQLKKLLQKSLKLIIYTAILVGAVVFIWSALDTLFRPRFD